ncbi:MAG: CheR family methyltransferase [Candidatus Thermoplasmatota archaeon]
MILRVEDIPKRLVEFARHLNDGAIIEPHALHEEGLQGVLSLVRIRNGHDFRPYKENTLLRRIHRRMGLKGKKRMDDYSQLLRSDPKELEQLRTDLLISVTSFFRDTAAFSQFAQAIRPTFEDKSAKTPVRAWVAGCATGEEAYSVAMTLLETRDAAGATVDLQIFATDVSEEAITTARTGTYPEAALADVSAKRRDQFFAKTDSNHYRFKKELRDVLVFATHNVLVDPPFFNLDIITCRNVLIYLKPEAQKKILALFHAALKPNGILFLGTSETVGADSGFEPLFPSARIYQRVGPARRAQLTDTSTDPETASRPLPKPVPLTKVASAREPPKLVDAAREWLLDAYAPATVLVDDQNHILYVHGPISKYLEFPRGEPKLDLMAMPRQGLGARLRAALYKAKREKRNVDIEGVGITRDGRTYVINVHVKPAPNPPFTTGSLIVTFEDATEAPPGTRPKTARRHAVKGEALAEQLEAELSATKADLQGTIETLETTNEEMKASNEEMMSMNEEFRSTNEELETSKEELQSLNEEVMTVNSQLKDKAETLEATNDDLLNLLRSTDVATIFLDRDFRISRFTPATRKLFTIIPSDVARPLSDISRKFTDEDLTGDLEIVLQDGSSVEKLIRANEGQWYQRRVQPYRTQDGRIAGIVVTFVDVDALKKAELATSAAKKYAENIVATVREPLLVLDTHLRVISANPAFYDVFQTAPDQTIGTLIFNLGNGQWNIPKLRQLIQEILPHGDEVRDFEVEHTFESIGPRTMLLNAKRVSPAQEQKEEQDELILLAIEDVTQRKTAEAAVKDLTDGLEFRVRTRTAELEEVNKVLSQANESLDAFAYVVGHDLKEPARAVETILTVLEEDHAADVPETVRALHSKARAANRRLASLVTGLLEFSRASRADVTNAHPLALDDALRMDDCTTRFRDRLAERDARLEYPGHDVIVHAHLPAVCQILGNLVENAVKHNPNPHPLVRVKAHGDADGRMIEVIVEDDGPGFPRDVIAGIERMSTTTRGFGLAIAKRTVELTGGKLWLGQSPEGGGAVHFTLPARARTADTAQETPPAGPKTFSEHAAQLGAEQRVRDRADTILRLSEANAKLEKANKALALTNEGLESFAYVVSHDIREPVRAIQAIQALIEEQDINPETRELLDRSRESTKRLAHLLKGLLDVSRASILDPHDLRSIRVADVIKSEACMTRYASYHEANHVELSIQENPPGLEAYGTPEHISEILGNLLLNAAKHNTNPVPRVHVSITHAPQDPSSILISIEDNGSGFDPKLINQFDRVKPGRPTTLRGGFGLIIVRRAVEKLGGSIAITRSERLGGAAVKVALPSALPAKQDVT